MRAAVVDALRHAAALLRRRVPGEVGLTIRGAVVHHQVLARRDVPYLRPAPGPHPGTVPVLAPHLPRDGIYRPRALGNLHHVARHDEALPFAQLQPAFVGSLGKPTAVGALVADLTDRGELAWGVPTVGCSLELGTAGREGGAVLLL